MAEDEKVTGLLGGSGRGCRVAPISATFWDKLPADMGGMEEKEKGEENKREPAEYCLDVCTEGP
jgi:hypothetical protein